MHTHLCEGEVDEMVARWGVRSIPWCIETGFFGPDVWIAHGRETLPDEYSILAENGTGISDVYKRQVLVFWSWLHLHLSKSFELHVNPHSGIK